MTTIRLIVFASILSILTLVASINIYRNYPDTFAEDAHTKCLELPPKMLQHIGKLTEHTLKKLDGLSNAESIIALSKYTKQFHDYSIKARIKNQHKASKVAQCVAENTVKAIKVYREKIGQEQEKIYSKLAGAKSKEVQIHRNIITQPQIAPVNTQIIDENTTARQLASAINNAIDAKTKKAVVEEFIKLNNEQVQAFANNLGVSVEFVPNIAPSDQTLTLNEGVTIRP